MPVKLTWSISAAVAGGPNVAKNRTVDLAGYDLTQVTVPTGGHPLDVDVQPADAADRVAFFMVTASNYDAALTYAIAGVAPPRQIVLDAPHVLTGSGAVGLLGGSPKRLTFTNNTAADVDVQVLVGRKAA
jgi:hypothetical protein